MLLKIAAFVIPLGFDTLAIAVILGVRGLGPLRPAVVFAVFEAVMPLIGLFIGRFVGARFETPAVVVRLWKKTARLTMSPSRRPA